MNKKVFISYHGGKGDASRSSYPMAEKLYDYLEGKGISCFLYKKSNNEDFYDAINEALLKSEHFILVARDKDMLSDWVRDEIKQFDSLRKNGMKDNCFISALLYGDITEDELFHVNTLFSTKDIVRGEEGIEKLYTLLMEKINSSPARREEYSAFTPSTHKNTPDTISRNFIDSRLLDCEESEEEFLLNCDMLTSRLKCMSEDAFASDCENVVESIFEQIKARKSANLLKVTGEPGTQKSYLLQMLYLFLQRNRDKHRFDPIYLHLQFMEDEIYQENTTQDQYLNRLFKNLAFSRERIPLFIVDGVLGVVINDNRLDYYIKKEIDRFRSACTVIGFNPVLLDNKLRINRSGLARGKYDVNVSLTPVSLYDKEKCIKYISTIEELEPCAEQLYNTLNSSGLLTVNEKIIRAVSDECEFENSTRINIMDLFETELLDYMDGDRNMLNRGAEIAFEFAYGTSEIDLNDGLSIKILKIISESTLYLNCLSAIYFCNALDRYEETEDISVFQIIFPKTVTRFIVKKVNAYPKYEKNLVLMGRRYNDFSSLGQSEMTFFLGRIKDTVYRAQAIELLNKFYDEQKNTIKEKRFKAEFFGTSYSYEEQKQDLFLLRGISVSLIYCGNKTVLDEYFDSLLNNDLANSINRGFHLEYYGDKKYLPNHNALDYEDDARVGERTLRILSSSCQGQLASGKLLLSFSIELFTIASLLQARMEIKRTDISFNIIPYMETACKLISAALNMPRAILPSLKPFYEMVLTDFKKYLDENMTEYSPKRAICSTFLNANEVKRAGWVMQNIEAPESIVEHMYSCFFIGLIFLPNTYAAYPQYDKQKILNMLLIHDLAETVLGDIPKYDKTADFEPKENAEMLRLLLKGTYDGVSVLKDHVDAWSSWYARGDENARIAKDIDTLQAIYQFLVYYNRTPQNFSDERVINWLKETRELYTELGKRILTELILKNPDFSDTLTKFDGQY